MFILNDNCREMAYPALKKKILGKNFLSNLETINPTGIFTGRFWDQVATCMPRREGKSYRPAVNSFVPGVISMETTFETMKLELLP